MLTRYKLPPKFEKSPCCSTCIVFPPAITFVLVEADWSAFRLHALLRERGVRFVTLLLDGDAAGR
jgi:hypothetical protein